MSDFVDRGFKTYATLLAANEPEFKSELKLVRKKVKVDRDAWDFHPKIAEFLFEFPLSDTWLASVETIGYPAPRTIQNLIPGWDGEEAPYRFQTCTDLLLFPNLLEFSWPESHRRIEISEIPDHPSIVRFVFPTSFFETKKGTNDPLFEALEERGFKQTNRVDFGFSTLEKAT